VTVASKLVVCLVDDDSSVRKAIFHLLESDGYTVNVFAEPEAFLEHLASNVVSVLVLDLWGTDVNGLQLLAHLSANSPHTRVIFINGREDAGAEQTARDIGVFDFFRKPFDGDKLLNSVRMALVQDGNGS
jgi:FixJ family two-component response regulator